MGCRLSAAMNIQTDMTTPILMEAGRVSKYGLPLTGAGLVEAPMDYIPDMILSFRNYNGYSEVPGKVAAAARPYSADGPVPSPAACGKGEAHQHSASYACFYAGKRFCKALVADF